MADLLLHDFVAAPFYPDRCDAKLDADGQLRTCTRPPSEHLDRQPIGSLPKKMPEGWRVVREGPYLEIHTDDVSGLLTAVDARALARMLLLRAIDLERG